MTQQSQYRCPRCRVGEGSSIKVTAATEGAKLTLRCPLCDHEWEIETQPRGTRVPRAS